MTSNNVTIAQGTRHKAQGTRPLLSVIIPVYNVEKYLNKCVQSVVNQTYTNLEIILVDDGSPDNCPVICEEWAKKDSRIRVIHKKNGGYASARNEGLKIANGSLIGILDSDDYVAVDMYEKLYNLLSENDADLSVCDFQYVDEDYNFIPDKGLSLKNEVLSGQEALENYVKGILSWHCVVVWNKLYKREIFTNLSFCDGSIHEDSTIIHRLFVACKKVAFTSEKLNFYMQRASSTMGEVKRTIFHKKHFHDSLYAYEDLYNLLIEMGRYDLANIEIKTIYGTVLDTLSKINYLQYRRDISPFLRDTFYKLIKSGKFTYWLRAVKLAFVLFSSIFRPFINEEQIK